MHMDVTHTPCNAGKSSLSARLQIWMGTNESSPRETFKSLRQRWHWDRMPGRGSRVLIFFELGESLNISNHWLLDSATVGLDYISWHWVRAILTKASQVLFMSPASNGFSYCALMGVLNAQLALCNENKLSVWRPEAWTQTLVWTFITCFFSCLRLRCNENNFNFRLGWLTEWDGLDVWLPKHLSVCANIVSEIWKIIFHFHLKSIIMVYWFRPKPMNFKSQKLFPSTWVLLNCLSTKMDTSWNIC